MSSSNTPRRDYSSRRKNQPIPIKMTPIPKTLVSTEPSPPAPSETIELPHTSSQTSPLAALNVSSDVVSPSPAPLGQSTRQPQTVPPVLPVSDSLRKPSPARNARTPSPSRIKSNNIPIILNVEDAPTHEPQYNPDSRSLLEEILESCGYAPQDKILISDSSDNHYIRYIKAINNQGHIVYIDIDTDYQYLPPSDNPPDNLYVESKLSSPIPYSIKMGSYECTNGDTCGVIFECDGGLCSLTRDPDSLQPVEHTLIPLNLSQSDDILDKIINPVPYPVIRLGELKCAPDQVLKGLDIATRRLRNANYLQCAHDLSSLGSLIERVRSLYGTFSRKQHAIFETLGSTLRELGSYYFAYELDPSKVERDPAQFNLLVYNLRRRQELIVELLMLCQSITSFHDVVSNQIKQLEEVNNHIDKHFSGIDSVLYE